MRRFERVIPAKPPRQGVNPFTGKTHTFPGRPGHTTLCDLEVAGAAVREYWTWLREGANAATSRGRKHEFPDRERANADLEGVVADLLHEGFREVGIDPGEPREEAGAPHEGTVSPATLEERRRLAEGVAARCRSQGWFGTDMARKNDPESDAVEWKRFRFEPASEAQLAETERLLGFPIPPMLRTIYAEVANGGFGPGYGLVGAVGGARESMFETDIGDAYRRDRDISHDEPTLEWPRRMLRIVEWGCGIWSCLDARSGQMLRYEPAQNNPGLDDPAKDMIAEDDSLEEWLARWARGEDLYRSV